MSDLNYGLGFYLIEVATDQYDLFNTVTDNKILEAEPREKIINFLELNLPTHPFLYKVDQETDPFFFSSTTAEEINKYFEKVDLDTENHTENHPETTDSSFFLDDKYRYNYNNYTSTTNYIPDFFSPFGSDASYSNGFVERDDTREEDESVQLEFDFTYENSKGKETISSNTSPDNEAIINEYFGEDVPFLPDDTDGDTDQGKNINKGIERMINQPSPQSYAGFLLFYIYGSKVA